MPPPKFIFDSRTEIAMAITDDVGCAINDIVPELSSYHGSVVIKNAAELLLPKLDGIEDIYKHKAFYDAGMIACKAFLESDLSSTAKIQTYKRFKIATCPSRLSAITLNKPWRLLTKLQWKAQRRISN